MDGVPVGRGPLPDEEVDVGDGDPAPDLAAGPALAVLDLVEVHRVPVVDRGPEEIRAVADTAPAGGEGVGRDGRVSARTGGGNRGSKPYCCMAWFAIAPRSTGRWLSSWYLIREPSPGKRLGLAGRSGKWFIRSGKRKGSMELKEKILDVVRGPHVAAVATDADGGPAVRNMVLAGMDDMTFIGATGKASDKVGQPQEESQRGDRDLVAQGVHGPIRPVQGDGGGARGSRDEDEVLEPDVGAVPSSRSTIPSSWCSSSGPMRSRTTIRRRE